MPEAALAAAPPRRPFGATFWALNTIEMWERLAYYTLSVMAPVYIMQADDPGGLHLTAWHKGTILAWGTAVQSLLPMVTGGFADRYGYKRVLLYAFMAMTGGYLVIAFGRDLKFITTDKDQWNFILFFAGVLILAAGTAFFKPALQGSLARILPKESSSLGWSVFYWVVNIGAWIGHFMPVIFMGKVHTAEAWRNLFLAAAGISSLNFLMLLTFKDIPSGASKTDGLLTVLWKTVANLWDARLIAWLLIMSGFWMMMYQLWDMQPNFISDWIDSRPAAEKLSFLPEWLYERVTADSPRGRQIPQNVILSLNSTFIIIGVVGMGWITRRMRTLTAMLGGMLAATVGVLVAGLTMSPWMLFLGILCFSIGEMTTGPKKNEYLALIAPPGKAGLYLGYVNIPVGIGRFIGSKLSGHLYGNYGEKATLALKYLKENNLVPTIDPTTADPEKFKTPLEAALQVARTDAVTKLIEVKGISATQAAELLWQTYHPQYYTWLPFAATGVVCAFALAIFGKMAKRWSDMNA